MALNIFSPNTLFREIPLSSKGESHIQRFRQIARNIFSGRDQRLVCILGPCSIHDFEGALAYAKLFKRLSEQVEDSLFLVMRVYVEKPRTVTGWKGILNDPFLNGTDDIETGIRFSRELFSLLTDMGIPIATEFVNPLSSYYLHDLVTWGFIGARTCVSQSHREIVSSFSFPVGFKNTVDGNIKLPIDSIIASRTNHTFLGLNQEGHVASLKSPGNPYTHLVLRGSDKEPNYDSSSLQKAFSLQENCGIHSPIMIDCAHGNSQKNHLLQEEVFQDLLAQISSSSQPILGFMLESYLEEGNQTLNLGESPSPSISITDPCMSWERTENLLLSSIPRVIPLIINQILN